MNNISLLVLNSIFFICCVKCKRSVCYLTISISCPFGQLSYICIVSENDKHRTILFYKNYFEEFFIKLRQKAKDKIIWTFNLIEDLSQVPETYLKHIETTDGLYEIRVQQGGDIFRIFCFFDKGKLIVVTSGFHKKTQKTPRQEIEKALKIKEEYYAEKK